MTSRDKTMASGTAETACLFEIELRSAVPPFQTLFDLHSPSSLEYLYICECDCCLGDIDI